MTGVMLRVRRTLMGGDLMVQNSRIRTDPDNCALAAASSFSHPGGG